jgi:tetraacyldisaccharide 4'-kinase
VKGEIYYTQLVAGERRQVADRLLLGLLKVCAALYAGVMRLRAAAYACGLLPVKRLPVTVISVGNITMGGTGKTPTVLLIARELMARGRRVTVLTRGYGGSLEGETRIVSDGNSLLLSPAEAGDEPCLLAASLPGLMVVMGADRYRAGCLALKELSADCFILDDGFQHQRLARNLDILLLDSEAPFGNGRTVPAGFLREPPSAAGRADLVILTRCADGATVSDCLPAAIPICRSSHFLTGYTPLAGGELRPFAELAGKRIVAFCGIANPAAFFDGIEASGVPLVSTLAFPDHTGYGTREIEALGRLKQQSRAGCLITTAKDAVKLQSYAGIIGDCYVARLELTLHNPEPLTAALDEIL